MRRLGTLAAVGTTGNNTSAGVSIPVDVDVINAEIKVEAVGATPTITYKLQGSDDDGTVADAASDWYDLSMLPEGANTEVATDTKTAVGVYEYSLEQARRPTSKVRLVTSANTNVTYSAELRGVQLEHG
jgi:hypothetical protein